MSGYGPIPHSIEIRPLNNHPNVSNVSTVIKTNDAEEAFAWYTVLTNPLVTKRNSASTVPIMEAVKNSTSTSSNINSPIQNVGNKVIY